MVAKLRVTTNQKDPLRFFSYSSDTLNISQGGIMVKKPVVKKSATETGKDKNSKVQLANNIAQFTSRQAGALPHPPQAIYYLLSPKIL